MLRTISGVLALAMITVACGEPQVAAPTTTTSMAPTSTTTPTTIPSDTSTTSTTLPGEVIEIGPVQGDTLMVVGVAHDDVLNLRAAPGANQPIVNEIDPTEKVVEALGETRQIPGALWVNVEVDGVQGWVNLRYLGYEGATVDLTADVVGEPGLRPVADDMTALGLAVAETLASEDPPSRIVLVVAESVGDLGEVTYDVIGLGDDSVLGYRLHIFGERDGAGFALKSVEATVICGRGVTDDGLCV